METFLIDVPVPSMGATVNELTVIDLLVTPGARITKGQKIAELESDKSVFDFEAPCAGTVMAVQGRAGDILPSGAPFLRIETADNSLKHLQVKESGVRRPEAGVRSREKGRAAAGSTLRAEVPATKSSDVSPASGLRSPAPAVQWTPRASKLAQEAGLDPAALADIPATGPGGRISGDDVARYLAGPGGAQSRIPSAQPPPAATGFESFATETVCVAGIGFAVPDNVRANSEILKAFPKMTEAEIVKLTGIQERRFAGEDETATHLAAIAVQHALAQARVHVSEIDGIIMATLLPDQPVPSAASGLARHLGIKTALAFDLNAACAGWLYALEVGRALIRAGTAKKLLVVTAELLSRITNPKDHSTAFLFGDGAGAAVLVEAGGGHRLNRMHLSGDASFFEAIQRPGGGAMRPMPQPNGDDLHHFYLQMNGAVVFRNAVIAFADIIERTLRRHRLGPEDVQWVVPHQANERILKAVSKRVGISYEKFVVTLGKYGNTSAASVSMALGWAAEEGIFRAGDKIVCCAVGAGFTYAGGLLTW
ncbi:MAG: beta-ketoacyl-ACP synthase 3 [Opitutaceae bacterium]|nr:beta-ketoacyl-ACP synthase 3 [Opitutaceae bacterium]